MSECLALSTRVRYYWLRQDKEPKVIRDAVAAVCRHASIPEGIPHTERRNRNDHHRASIYCVHSALEAYSQYKLAWSLYRHYREQKRRGMDGALRYDRPWRTRKEHLLRIAVALSYYHDWM